MALPSPTSSDKDYWGDDDGAWLDGVSPSMLAGDPPVGESGMYSHRFMPPVP